MVDLALLETVGILGTAVATIALVLLLYRTVKQLEATVSLSRVQVEFRFRPWIGPLHDIKRLPQEGTKCKYECTIKNYGEIPSKNVIAFCKIDSKLMSRDVFKKNPGSTFDLGPLLPNMLKHYWIFIESELIEKAKSGSDKIFSALYFEYEVNNQKNGYGMISEYDPKLDSFVHKDMWVDSQNNLRN
jgi:hypothetical protein